MRLVGVLAGDSRPILPYGNIPYGSRSNSVHGDSIAIGASLQRLLGRPTAAFHWATPSNLTHISPAVLYYGVLYSDACKQPSVHSNAKQAKSLFSAATAHFVCRSCSSVVQAYIYMRSESQAIYTDEQPLRPLQEGVHQLGTELFIMKARAKLARCTATLSHHH